MRDRLPARLFVISAGVFTIGLSEFMITGILAPMSAALHRPEPTIALLVTVFAAAVVLSAPVTAALTARLPPRTTLGTAAAVFAVVHALSALSPAFWPLVVLRAVAGIACGTFLSVGNVAGIRMAGARNAPRAIAVMVGGLTVANVLGLPAAAWLGANFGWTAPFWLVAALSAVLAGTLGRTPMAAPRDPGPLGARLRAEVAVLRGPALLTALGTTVCCQAAMFATYTYLQPLLTGPAGLPPRASGPLLALFGVGTLVGVSIGGALAHRGLLRNTVAGLLATVGVLGLLLAGVHQPVAVYALVPAFGVATFSLSAPLNGRVFALAGSAPTLASGVNIAVLNVGNGLGPAVAGPFVRAGGYLLVPWLSIGFAAVALGLVGASVLIDRRTARAGTRSPARHYAGSP